MPWTVDDVEGFKKGLSDEDKSKWVAIANAVLKGCKDKGGSEEECAGQAVRTANSRVG
jgi:uncharacterized protein YdaT